ncbi:MAG: aspartate aminotransferase family protein [Thermoplasmata archaeon]|nr:aspartate aminotransferase family protein [Thermoplasmata archaeon]MCI4356153.1 aspartate aminotransferase family protein [Thermoplasmata archaeon]
MAEPKLALPSGVRSPGSDPELGSPVGAPPELLGHLSAEGSAAAPPEPAGKPTPKAEAAAAPKDDEEEVQPLPIPIARLVPKLRKSARLFEEGKKYIPNSTSSLIRVASYDPCPPFIKKGKGSRIWDVDDNEYLDFNLGYGCLINGHAHPEIVKALCAQAELGTHFASPTELEIDVAKAFHRMVPNTERVAFCSNGSDATMNAIRIARAVTGKDGILKFEGHYHGQHDYALISAEAPPIVAGLDEYPRPLPNSAGIPPGVTDYVMVAPYNSIPAFERMVRRYRDRLAAVILEPIMANAGVIPPAPDYLKRLREITRENDLLLIFDEVFTGFRVHPGGAQALYKVEPDLSCWAKALGGGVTISAVSGKAEFMDLIAPGRISFGGTYFANNLSLAGSLANLKILERGGDGLYERFDRMTTKLEKGIEQAAKDAKVSVLVQSVNGMLQFFFTRRKKITNYRESLQIDWNLYLRNHQLLLDKGIYTHPDNYERITFSSAHTEKDVDVLVDTIHETFAEIRTLPRDYLP